MPVKKRRSSLEQKKNKIYGAHWYICKEMYVHVDIFWHWKISDTIKSFTI